MTSAPVGIAAPAPTPAIFPSVTTTIPGFTSASLLPSNIRAALSTYVLLEVFCAWPNVGDIARKFAHKRPIIPTQQHPRAICSPVISPHVPHEKPERRQ